MRNANLSHDDAYQYNQRVNESIQTKTIRTDTMLVSTSIFRSPIRRCFASVATVAKEKVPGPGSRLLLEETESGQPILLANVDETYYAFDAMCPHMNKSMEKGKIFTDKGPDPEIRCRIHNTRFNMRTGKCSVWVSGLLGMESKLVGSVAQKVGGERQDIKAYKVVANDDGSLSIDDD